MNLKAEQYWEWRTTIAEMQLAEERYKCGQSQHNEMSKDLEIARLRTFIFKQNLTTSKEKAELAKQEYTNFKEKLEKELGISLNNKAIDDVTFEIKEIE